MNLRGHDAQLILFATLIKFLLCKKQFFMRFFFFLVFGLFVCFFYSSYFASSYLLSQLSLLRNFCCFKCYFLVLFKALKGILLLVSFIFLLSYILLLLFSFQFVSQFVDAHNFPFHIFFHVFIFLLLINFSRHHLQKQSPRGVL